MMLSVRGVFADSRVNVKNSRTGNSKQKEHSSVIVHVKQDVLRAATIRTIATTRTTTTSAASQNPRRQGDSEARTRDDWNGVRRVEETSAVSAKSLAISAQKGSAGKEKTALGVARGGDERAQRERREEEVGEDGVSGVVGAGESEK